MIELWHRCLKTAILCHANPTWTRVLSTVMLGLRNNVMDTGSSPAEYLYGTTLRIPGEFVLPDDELSNSDPRAFIEEFRAHMQKVKPVPVGQRHKKRAFLFKDLATCTHVFLRAGTTKKALERPYTGPHKVLKRTTDRVVEIEVNGKPRSVSIENVKPAYTIRESYTEAAGDPAVATKGNELRTYANKKRVTFATERRR
ncbi:hypothetical protein WN55_04311 [Dufourea novaeangliae]|uniref:DUF5641 domain-containing protein n=1 Tax=Dufourea novaeangliae TaxID=178035 RepID=A0A154PM24_DUFNO|nr:hypothetical protein WN55_04311 [Dufourea novaeangliae]